MKQAIEQLQNKQHATQEYGPKTGSEAIIIMNKVNQTNHFYFSRQENKYFLHFQQLVY